MSRRALITGIAGQDGAYLARLLLERGYEVYGGFRRGGTPSTWRLEALGILGRIRLIEFELLDGSEIKSKLAEVRPDEIYNLGGQSLVSASFDQPLRTTAVNSVAVAHILEAIRWHHRGVRFYQASSSEMFGHALTAPQNENTPFRPQSPYAVSKVYAHQLTALYRQAHGLHVCSGILFNHESPLRGINFVTRKISATFAGMKLEGESAPPLQIGNLDAKRDWGFAGEYVKGMVAMLQSEPADDFLLATGRIHSVREFIETAARLLDYEIDWQGHGIIEQGRDRRSGRLLVVVNPANFRPIDLEALVGDATRAKQQFGWQATVSFEQLVSMMVKADFDRIRRGERLR
jgi:GDPmannose 4,6-dehydratase